MTKNIIMFTLCQYEISNMKAVVLLIIWFLELFQLLHLQTFILKFPIVLLPLIIFPCLNLVK